MFAWCPTKKVTFRVSKGEIETLSTESTYWIQGFLSGNEPPPPMQSTGPGDPEFDHWFDSAVLFQQTGHWSSEPGNCERCGQKKLFATLSDLCAMCTTS
jgi:hypothetical protein